MEDSKFKETGLGDLIGRIKSEGVEEASRLGNEIISEARKKAEAIISSAKENAEAIIAAADEETKEREARSNRAIEMALRDALLQLRSSMEGLLDDVVRKDYSAAIKGEALEGVLLKVIEAWRQDSDSEVGIEVLLSENDRMTLSRGFMASLKKEFTDGVELKVHPGIKAGFRVAERGGAMHYDFTEEAITELLSRYLKEELRGILNEAPKGGKHAG